MDKDTNINFFQPKKTGAGVLKVRGLYALGVIALITTAALSINMYIKNIHNSENSENKGEENAKEQVSKKLTLNEINKINEIAKQRFIDVMELKDTNVLKNNGYHNNLELSQNWIKDNQHVYVYKKGIKTISITLENKTLEQLQPKNCNVNNQLEVQYCEYEIPYSKVTKIYNKNKNEKGSFDIILSKNNGNNNVSYKIQSFIMKENK